MADPLDNKLILVTGAAKRIGKAIAIGLAHAGADIIIHHGHSSEDAQKVQGEIQDLGRHAHIIQADFGNIDQLTEVLGQVKKFGQLYALINNASIFEPLTWDTTDLVSWQRHVDINLTAPFILSQSFARQIPQGESGRIINILDWRALRPGKDHFPYTITKAALAALTRSFALALAPNITVNGIALGAILPPSTGAVNTSTIEKVPATRWGTLEEVISIVTYLLQDANYTTGEIIHIDGGRHLV